MKRNLSHGPARLKAFSLIELLVVVGIIAFLIVMAAPTMTSAFKGSKLTQGAEAVRNFLALAQQTAIKDNVSMEVRFYTYDDPDTPESTEHYLGYRMYAIKPSKDVVGADQSKPVTFVKGSNFTKLPQGVVISSNAEQSTLLGELVISGTEPDVKGITPGEQTQTLSYKAFRFRPDGSMSLSTNRKWFLTLMSRDEYLREKQDTPDNFVTLQVNVNNGQIRWLQPN